MNATAIKERPILFSGPMVRAILEGRKTQTRRIAKVPDTYAGIGTCHYHPTGWALTRFDGGCSCHTVACPYGRPGDQLWVRETWALVRPWYDHDSGGLDEVDEWHVPVPESCPRNWHVWYAADSDDIEQHQEDRWVKRYRPSIYMPRWASRITLEITDVRVQRLHEISEEDARAEGVSPVIVDSGGFTQWDEPINVPDWHQSFFDLWAEINGIDSLNANPWVWAITFRRVEGGGQ